MYLNKHVYQVMEGEPQLGKITEYELVEYDGEALEILIDTLVASQEVPEEFYAIDDYNDEDIPLKTSDYISDEAITLLNALFAECSNWDEEQIAALITVA